MFENARKWLETASIEELNESFGFNKVNDTEGEDDYGDWTRECDNCGKRFHGLEGVFDDYEGVMFCKKCAKEEWGFGKINLSEVDIQDLVSELEERGLDVCYVKVITTNIRRKNHGEKSSQLF